MPASFKVFMGTARDLLPFPDSPIYIRVYLCSTFSDSFAFFTSLIGRRLIFEEGTRNKVKIST